MKVIRKFGYIICLLLLVSMFCIQLALPALTLAADEQTKQEIILSTKYPELKGNATSNFEFSVDVLYAGGTEPKNFNLAIKGPDEYFYNIQQSYGSTADIASVKLDPSTTYAESLKIKATPNILNIPEPGDYILTFEVTSGDIRGTLDLKIIVTARYAIDTYTPDGLLSGQINPGKDNFFKINIENTGSSDLENINLTTYVRGAPSGWDITFEPERINSLAPKNTREVKLNIKPSSKTISGDYEVVITAKPENASTSDELTLRVTVLTRTIWGWVGVAIVVLVVAGLIAMFIFLGRR